MAPHCSSLGRLIIWDLEEHGTLLELGLLAQASFLKHSKDLCLAAQSKPFKGKVVRICTAVVDTEQAFQRAAGSWREVVVRVGRRGHSWIRGYGRRQRTAHNNTSCRGAMGTVHSRCLGKMCSENWALSRRALGQKAGIPLAVVDTRLALAGSWEEAGAGGFGAGNTQRVDIHCVVVGEEGHCRGIAGGLRSVEGGRERTFVCSARKPSAGGGALPKKDQGRRRFVSSA
ncbi:hypothetical protein DFH08DRAFT_823671 [Mycena albidolilacea]|uniref:Uncharacterized protein n=1 Tax=Mycena albidolilacea TaxID=1033008 RepID=A0AAD6Z6E9_9AGAR|nr:hypothetical protein DFH08DRAFT_823671 [Mycena albidolilacea]